MRNRRESVGNGASAATRRRRWNVPCAVLVQDPLPLCGDPQTAKARSGWGDSRMAPRCGSLSGRTPAITPSKQHRNCCLLE
jgi:hypothetical protein